MFDDFKIKLHQRLIEFLLVEFTKDPEPIFGLIVMGEMIVVDKIVSENIDKVPIIASHIPEIASKVMALEAETNDTYGVIIRFNNGELSVIKTPIVDDPQQLMLLETLVQDDGVQFEVGGYAIVNVNKFGHFDIDTFNRKFYNHFPRPLIELVTNPPKVASVIKSNMSIMADDWQFINGNFGLEEELVVIAVSRANELTAVIQPLRPEVVFE